MQLRHLLIALLVPLTWGFGFALAKAGLDHFPPLLLMSMRFAIAAAVLVWFVPVPRNQWRNLTIIALVSATMQYGLTFSGLARIDATPAVLLVQSEVVMGILMAAIILKERPTLRQHIIPGRIANHCHHQPQIENGEPCFDRSRLHQRQRIALK